MERADEGWRSGGSPPLTRAEVLVAVAAAAGLTALAFPGVALWRGAPAVHDLLTHHVPWRAWIAGRWLSGHLPLWNPDAANGFPMLAEPQTGALYPATLLFGLLDPFAALNAVVVSHVALALLGMYLFARSLRQSRPGAAIAAAVFGVGGFTLAHVVYLPMLCSLAWIPLVLLGIDGAVRDGRPRAALGMAGAAAAMVLAGHPQAALLGAYLAASYALVRLLAGYPGHGPPRRQRLRRGWTLVAAAVFAGVLVAPQLLATLELAAEGERAGGVDEEFAMMGALPPQEVVNAVLPRTFGFERPADIPLAHHHHGELYWGNGQTYWDDVIFVGVPAMLLALLGVVAGARGTRFFAAWAAVAALLMVGSPLYLLWRLLPGADLLRFPARFGLLWTVAVAVLAGAGLDAWVAAARERLPRYVWATRAVVVALVLAWIGAAAGHAAIARNEDALRERLGRYYEDKLARWRAMADDPPPGADASLLPPPPEPGEVPVTVATLYRGDDYYGRKADRIVAELRAGTAPLGTRVLLPLGMAVGTLALIPLAARRRELRWGVVALAVADLLAFGAGFNPVTPWDELRAEPELLAPLRAEAARMDGNHPLRVATVDRAVPLDLSARMVGASGNLLVGVAEATIPTPLRMERHQALVSSAGLSIDMLRPADRLEMLASRMDRVRALGVTHLQSALDLGDVQGIEPVIQGQVSLVRVRDPWPRAQLLDAAPAPLDRAPPPGRALAVTVDEPGHLEIDLHAVAGGVVVVTENDYPGWVAEVDGEPAPIRRALGTLMAVPVASGADTLVLRYRPTALLVTLAAFPLAWALWAVWFAMAGARGRGRRRILE